MMLNYDAKGNIVAAENMIMKHPWKVYESKKYIGHHFFFNTETNTRMWALDPQTFDKQFVTSLEANIEEEQEAEEEDEASVKSSRDVKQAASKDNKAAVLTTRRKVAGIIPSFSSSSSAASSASSSALSSAAEEPSYQQSSGRLPEVSPISSSSGRYQTKGKLQQAPFQDYASIQKELRDTASFDSLSSSGSSNGSSSHLFMGESLFGSSFDKLSSSGGSPKMSQRTSTSSFDGISALNKLFPTMPFDDEEPKQDIYPEKLIRIPAMLRSPSLNHEGSESLSLLNDGASSVSSLSSLGCPPVSPMAMKGGLAQSPGSRSGGSWDNFNVSQYYPTNSSGGDNLLTRQFPLQKRGDAPCFEVTGGLGCGGCGVVVEVEHIYSIQRYAMKVVNKGKEDALKSGVKDSKAQVENELMVLSISEGSPFLQNCLFAFENSYHVYFIMDLYSGGDLFNFLSKTTDGGLPELQCRTILAELYLGLEHLHANDIIHRDIKIENVMFDGNGHVKLIDFGFAKKLKQSREKMSPVGSLLYMSPELIMNSEGGRHTDWWAYGILAFEILTGRTPWSDIFNSKTVQQEIQCKIFTPTPPASSPNSTCMSYDAWKLVEGLLNRKVAKRLGTKADADIMMCSFFKGVDWELTRQARSPPVFLPSDTTSSVKHTFAREDRNNALGKYDRHVAILKLKEANTAATAAAAAAKKTSPKPATKPQRSSTGKSVLSSVMSLRRGISHSESSSTTASFDESPKSPMSPIPPGSPEEETWSLGLAAASQYLRM